MSFESRSIVLIVFFFRWQNCKRFGRTSFNASLGKLVGRIGKSISTLNWYPFWNYRPLHWTWVHIYIYIQMITIFLSNLWQWHFRCLKATDCCFGWYYDRKKVWKKARFLRMKAGWKTHGKLGQWRMWPFCILFSWVGGWLVSSNIPKAKGCSFHKSWRLKQLLFF